MNFILYRDMSYYAAIFTFLLAAIKIALLVLNLMYIRSGDTLICDVDGNMVYYTEDMGILFVALFAS